VVATRIGADGTDAKKRQIHIDFDGPRLRALGEGVAPEVVASCGDNAKIYETKVLRDEYDGTWRVLLKFEPVAENKDPVDLRCTLKNGGETITETWNYLWSPP
jgi:glucans biosynthesis protein